MEAALGRNWKSPLARAAWPCRNLVLRKSRARPQAADAHDLGGNEGKVMKGCSECCESEVTISVHNWAGHFG